MRSITRIIVFSILAILLSTPVLAQKGKTKAAVKKLMKQFQAVGLSVAVVKNNTIVYNQSFGKKNIEQKTKIENNDIFRIASISKSFSATSVMQLVEAGKFSLNDDVSKLIGFEVRNHKFPDIVITLKMLLSHTSSLNDSEGYFTLDVINPAKAKNAAGCYSDYAPGTEYRYCNLNFNMVGTIIERYSGERFDQYVVKHVLNPLGLYGGYCIDSLDASRFVTLYEYDSASHSFAAQENAYNPRREEINNYMMGYSTPIFSPTGGMKISARDLATYMTMHMNYGKYPGGTLISEASAKEMQTPVNEKSGYGLALHTEDGYVAGKKLIGHTGSAYGLLSSMFFSPEEKFGIVVITNGSIPDANQNSKGLRSEVSQVLYDYWVK